MARRLFLLAILLLRQYVEFTFTWAVAVMYVRVGSFHDPKEYPGLVHFLEHLLFQGTEEYHGLSECRQHVASYLEPTNAYTPNGYTIHHFDIDARSLDSTLDR